MRKMFTTLKSVVAATVIAAMALAASCSYDDSAINERVDRVEKDLAALTERVAALEKKLGEEVDALKKLIEKQTVVTKVEKADDGSTKVTLSDGTSFTVYPKAEAGAEAVDTTIAPNKDTDGTYYWAVFDGGKFQKYLEVDGQKVPVFAAEGEGCVCELKFQVSEETGKLLVSIDGGKTWVDSGLAAQQVASTGVFSDVVVNDDNTVTFTLADGEKFSVALAELIECEAARDGVYVLPGEVKAVRFTVNDAVEDINIMNQPHGWAATVEVAPAEEENGDDELDGPVLGSLAAGGTDYVLNIAGPAVGDKYAAKEGVVSVHFNTANGACKVLSVNVNLAELTMSIDKNGNITLTNTVAMYHKPMRGEPYYDFANFFIGIMPKSLYEQYGNEALENDYDDMMGDYFNSAVTNRETGFGNVIDLQPYEDGVCEKEVYTFTVEQLCGAFYPKYKCQLGNEYVIFVSIEEENYIPVLDNAVMATYSCAKVEAELVEDSEKWNDATFNFALAGYTNYIIGWHDKAMVDSYIEQDMCESYADYLRLMSYDYLFGIGAVISGVIEGEVALSEISSHLDSSWADYCAVPELLCGTEYYFFVYPINIASEMDVYTHEFDVDAVVSTTFATSALVEGEFDAAATYGEHSFEVPNINVPVTIAGDDVDDVVYVAYQFFDSPVPVGYTSDRVEDMFGERSRYTKLVELDDTKAFNADTYLATNPCYLSMVLINANGEYVFVEKEFVNYTEYEFTSCENTEGKTYVFKNDTYTWTLNLKDVLASGTFTQSGTEDTYWDGNSTTLKESNTANLLGYIYGGTLKVELGESDALKVEFTSTDFTTFAGDKTPIKFVFDGTIGADQGGNAGAEIEVTSFEYLGRSGDLDDDPSTGGGDYVYSLVGADENEYKIGVYWDYVKASDPYAFKVNSMTYCFNQLDYMHSSWAGFVIVSEQYYYDSRINIEEGRLTLNLVGVGTYVYEDEKIKAPEKAPEFTIPGDGTYDYDWRYTTLAWGPNSDSNSVRVSKEDGFKWDIAFNNGLASIEPGDYVLKTGPVGTELAIDNYYTAFEFGAENNWVYYDSLSDPAPVNVQKNGDFYCITSILTYNNSSYRLVYIGKIVSE